MVFDVEYSADSGDEAFHVTELDCSVYYGDKTVEINTNQDKYEKRVQILFPSWKEVWIE